MNVWYSPKVLANEGVLGTDRQRDIGPARKGQ